ncbi:hypothetical protein [Vibrio sp. 16]|jgi:hypothetical protein|uniref:hypothetical protein n=1 Tax=Vibrio sp. 16 TaxID=391586 RepID=UPI00018F3AC5|nr:hypothetical protein [Vibrio sp. 16]EED28555.1 conserved hypothetical protein [Vibrio sp. 16]CAK4074714.1 hypothetical protein VDT1_3560 [Vibrio sp. 16]
MFKIFAVFFVAVGIYVGFNYSEEIEQITDTKAFEQVQEQAEEGKEALLDKIDEFKG